MTLNMTRGKKVISRAKGISLQLVDLLNFIQPPDFICNFPSTLINLHQFFICIIVLGHNKLILCFMLTTLKKF